MQAPIKSALAALTVIVGAAGLAACSPGGNTPTPTEGPASATLTIAMSGDTFSLDPTSCAPPVFCYPTYDSLIRVGADGSYQPDLATSWDFTDDTHQTLRVELRTDAVFNDGTPLDAEAVSASITRFLNSMGPNRSNAVPIAAVEIVDEHTVDIQYSMPVTFDYASFQLSDQNGVGAITSVAAASDPTILDGESAGIGPYKLDPAETQKGSQYTFVPNEDYFNQDAITYAKVVIKPIPNPASRVSAIQSGQVDWAHSVPASFAASLSGSGLKLSEGSNGGTTVLVLGDRESGPLSDVRVREAISLAIPREDIATTVFAGYATPTSSLVPAGLQGYNAASAENVGVDLDKARELMAAAGYADGFELSVLDPTFFDPGNAVGQSIVGPLAEIGITVALTADDSEPGIVVQKMFSKEFSAVVFTGQGLSAYGTATVNLSPMGYFNPFGLPGDDALNQAVTAAALAATPEEQAELEQEATALMDGLYWAVPIVAQTSIQATTNAVAGVPDTFVTRELNPFGPIAADAWAPATK